MLREDFILQKEKSKLSKKDVFIYILMALTGILITVTGIYYKQSFLRILPLYNSLIIAMLQSRVNRYSNLLGSINSLLYAAVYFYYKLYASFFSALLFSFPMQMITFIRWNKNKWESSTVLKKLSWKMRAVLIAGYGIMVIVMWRVLPLLGAEYAFLDSATNILGVFVLFLTMFAYIEYTTCMMINGVIGIALYVAMLEKSPETMPFLIFSVYSFICICFAYFEAKRLYKKQNKEI